MEVAAVFFDAVGTLIRPHPSVGAVYAAVATRHGLRGEPSAVERAFALAWRERAPCRFGPPPDYRTDERSERDWWRDTVACAFRKADLPEPQERCFQDIFAAFARPSAWRILEDAPPVLSALRRGGFRIGVASNFDSRLHAICRGLGLDGVVDFVLPSAQVGHAKPAPQIFRAALARAGTAPELALMVGDSPRDDFEAARAAGLQALLLDRTARHSGPRVITSLAALEGRLGL